MKCTLISAILISFLPLNTWAAELRGIYQPDTLIIDIPASELQKNPIWQNHGVPYDEFLNVQAFANRRDGEYQCTELVHRFLRDIYGVPTRIGIGLGNAEVVVQNIYQRFGHDNYLFGDQRVRMSLNEAGKSSEPPAAGSLVNFSSGQFGHVVVIRYVEIESASRIKVYLFEQHGFPVWQPGQVHGLRSVVFTKNAKNQWNALQTSGVGRPVTWLNFKIN